MEKPIYQRLKQRIREHGEAYKIDQLCLDELPIKQFTPDLTKLIEKCSSLDYLSLNTCQLQSLNNLPQFPKLALLQLSNNKIDDSHLQKLTQYPYLNQLSVSQNQIKSLESLKILQVCTQLMKINVSDNPFCSSIGEEYIGEIFRILPQVQFVNGYNKNGNKEEGSSEEEDYDNGESDQDSEEEVSDEEGENESPEKRKK